MVTVKPCLVLSRLKNTLEPPGVSGQLSRLVAGAQLLVIQCETPIHVFESQLLAGHDRRPGAWTYLSPPCWDCSLRLPEIGDSCFGARWLRALVFRGAPLGANWRGSSPGCGRRNHPGVRPARRQATATRCPIAPAAQVQENAARAALGTKSGRARSQAVAKVKDLAASCCSMVDEGRSNCRVFLVRT